MLHVAVCEDDSSLLANIKDKVQNYFKEKNIMAMLETYDRSDLLKYDIQEGKYFDLVLSDIDYSDFRFIPINLSKDHFHETSIQVCRNNYSNNLAQAGR